ncbi:hypothetical protein PI126_g24448 [Phytophthora idaei]|nr:hypothetical protein PI126_g24448 [Phytophthora idaei]
MVYGVASVIRAIIVNDAMLFGLPHYSESAGCVVWMKLCEMLVRGEEDLALIGNDDDMLADRASARVHRVSAQQGHAADQGGRVGVLDGLHRQHVGLIAVFFASSSVCTRTTCTPRRT